MKRSKQFLFVFAIIAFTSAFISCKNNKKKDINKDKLPEELAVKTVNPTVLFENEYAKVSKVSLASGESQPTHDGLTRVIYALTDYSIDWEEQGKKLGTKAWKKGDVHFHEAGTHAAKNSGTTLAEWLVFTKKSTDLPECGENTVENDVTSVSPDFSEALFENEDFKITQVNLPVGKSIPMHSGINRIIYSLNDYNLKYESDKADKLDKEFNSGDIHWHEACKHALENIGDTEAKFLVVSYR
ncbi:hypothetical protein [Cyclobacterium qasimii]|uniref:Uncharacterized protein n=2 Tax=Cyclobacterium qasimii TaxID=1350429 RepID=S7WN89_9BACT|nr:hypothetical protein [Cyclobacterium qasimii]EPR68179.1 hypothetical protein ADICYQ_2899 [Cyclobacterium qasimii M12-11B]GEO19936.1 hypothetical protein CQA01_04700 [Cyclobacterium qasimii]